MSEEHAAGAQGKIVVFGGKRIRRAWVDEQWYFSVVDIVAALTDSDNPRNYWNMMKAHERKQSQVQLSTICVQLRLTSPDGKSYKTDCVNTEAAFRVIQSIPSPKAEPFKRWLAQVGHERIQEIENPELAQQRMRQLYKEKGYPDDWLERRVRGIAVRAQDGPGTRGQSRRTSGRDTQGRDPYGRAALATKPRRGHAAGLRHPHGRDLQGHLRPDALGLQAAQGSRAGEPPRPHDRPGTHLHDAWGCLHD